MRNLFILAGINPILVANSIIRNYHATDTNFVLIEKNDWDRPHMDAAARHRAQNHLVGMLQRLLPATVLECYPRPSFRDFFQDYRGYLAESRYLMKIGRMTKKQLPGTFDRLYYSGNARTQAYFMRHAARWIRLEHGLGDYWFTNIEPPFGRFYQLRKLLVRLLTGAMSDFPHEIVLTDGGRCLSFADNHLFGASVRHLPPPELTTLFSDFREIIEQEEPELSDEILSIIQQAERYKRVFLYLPIEDIVPLEIRAQVFDRQMSALLAHGARDALFIIKPHPSDGRDYTRWFAERKLQAVTVSHPLGSKMPAELYLASIPHARPIGCATSTLFFSRWWLDRQAYYISGGIEAHNSFFARIRADFAKDIAKMVVA